MLMAQMATVVLATDENSLISVEHMCKNLDAAAEWVDEHQHQLKKGERYDIYYRCKEEGCDMETYTIKVDKLNQYDGPPSQICTICGRHSRPNADTATLETWICPECAKKIATLIGVPTE